MPFPLHIALHNSFFFSMQLECKKTSWLVGSSFSIKKVAKSIPKIQDSNDMDLIDEDSLLTEEDLKKPQLPAGLI